MANPFPFSSGDVLTAANLNAIGDATAFTPSWTGLTVGNATEDWWYAIVNDTLIVQGFTTLGSTSSVTSSIRMTLPDSRTVNTSGFEDVGQATSRIGGTSYACVFRMNGTSEIYLETLVASGTYLTKSGSGTTSPATWGNGSIIRGSFAVVCS